MRILVTGACGFVGSTLINVFCQGREALGISEVIGLDNFSRAGSAQNAELLKRLGVKLVCGDVRLASDLESLPAVDFVIDASANPSVLAGRDGRTSSRQIIEHNLGSTINLLEYCKVHCAGFLLVSTSRVYSIQDLATLPVSESEGAFQLRLDEVNLPNGVSARGVSEDFSTEPPISLYGSSKLASEMLALEYGASFDFPVWINRCGVLAGAGQFGRADQGIFSFWLNAYLRQKSLTYIGFKGTGHQVRDCLHPRDLVSLLLQQMKHTGPVDSRILNLGGGVEQMCSLRQLSLWCESRWGQREIAGQKEERAFDIPWMVMDSSRAKKLWDWQPKTSLESILEEIAEHAESHENWLELSTAW